MIIQRLIQLTLYFVVAMLLARPVGRYLRRAYQGEPTRLGRLFHPLERWLCRLAGVPALPEPLSREAEMTWGGYTLSLLSFIGTGVILAHALDRLHGVHRAGSVVQSLVSAATGLALLLALDRGLRRRRDHQEMSTAGNFWMDLIRGSLYILLPLSSLLVLLLVSQRIVQPATESICGMLMRGL